MKTDCKRKRIKFQDLGKHKVVGHFDGGTISSDGGSLLLREIERFLGIQFREASFYTIERVKRQIVNDWKFRERIEKIRLEIINGQTGDPFWDNLQKMAGTFF